MSTPTVHNAEQHRILVAYGRGEDLAIIATQLGLKRDYVAGVVTSLAGLDRGRARELASAYDRQRSAVAAARGPAKAPTFVPPGPRAPIVEVRDADLPLEPPAAADEPEPAPARAVDELLDRADACDLPRARTLAARIRAAAAELRDLLDQHQAEADARARIAQAEADLAAAKAALRELRGTPAPAAAADRPARASQSAGDGPSAAEVRAWCEKTGTPCSAHGRVPQSATDAYLAAHPERAA